MRLRIRKLKFGCGFADCGLKKKNLRCPALNGELFVHPQKTIVSAECVPDFWYTLGSVTDGLGNSKFPRLSYFMTTMTVLSHSSASVERLFSQINRMNPKLTNSLQAETVENRILAKQAIHRKKLVGSMAEQN